MLINLSVFFKNWGANINDIHVTTNIPAITKFYFLEPDILVCSHAVDK